MLERTAPDPEMEGFLSMPEVVVAIVEVVASQQLLMRSFFVYP